MKFLLLSVLLIVFDRNSFAQLTQGDPRCPVDYAYDLSIFYPHESDCRKFYQCAEYGQLKEKICEHGMEFNRVENVSVNNFVYVNLVIQRRVFLIHIYSFFFCVKEMCCT